MSVLRSLGKMIFGFLFTSMLIATITTFSLISFTEPENLRGVIGGLIESQIPDDVGGSQSDRDRAVLDGILSQCEGKERIEDFQSRGIVIDCSKARGLLDGGDVREFVATMMVDSIYHKEYNCDFVSCLKEGGDSFMVLVSKKANDLYKQALNYMVVLTSLLGAIFVFLVKGLNARLKAVGFSLLWSSLPFVMMSFLTNYVIDSFAPPELRTAVLSVLDSVFSPTLLIYAYILIASVVIIIAGYVVKPENFRFSKKKK